MKFGTTQTSRIDSGSNKNSVSRRLGSSFQKAHPTSAKTFRRRISAACASVGALESGFTVEPWATIRSAESLQNLVIQTILNYLSPALSSRAERGVSQKPIDHTRRNKIRIAIARSLAVCAARDDILAGVRCWALAACFPAVAVSRSPEKKTAGSVADLVAGTESNAVF